MKIKYICFALIALCLTSCSEEDCVRSGNPKQEVRVTAGIANHSRIVLSDNGEYTHTLWQNGDQISLFTDTQSNLVYKTSVENNSAVADFTAVDEALEYIQDTIDVYACYPDVTLASEGEMVVKLPSTKSIDYNTEKLRAFGYAQNRVSNGCLNLSFQHLCAFLCLTESSKTIAGSRITVTTTSDMPLSIGDGDTFDFRTRTASLTHGNDTVQVKAVSETDSDNLMVYIPILPQPADAYITITATNAVGDTLFSQIKKAPGTGFVAGNVYKVKTVLQEKESLLALYETANGEGWNNNTNWGSDRPVGEWYGVTTDEYGWITAIDLSENNLTGSVTVDLNNFSSLTSINLDYNNMDELGLIGSASLDSISLTNSGMRHIQFENFKYVAIDCESLYQLYGSCDSLKVSNCDFGDYSTPFSGVQAKDAVIYNCKMHSCGLSSETLLFESSSTYDTWHCNTSKKLSIVNSTCSTICGGDFYDETVIELVNASLWRSNWDEESNVTLTATTNGAGWYALFEEDNSNSGNEGGGIVEGE